MGVKDVYYFKNIDHHITNNDFSLNWCKWANNKKIICSGSGTIETKARASRGGPSSAAGEMEGRPMYVINHDGSNATKLIKSIYLNNPRKNQSMTGQFRIG